MAGKLNVRQVAAYFGVEPKVVFAWVHRGLLAADLPPGHSKRTPLSIRVEEVARFEQTLQAQRAVPKDAEQQLSLPLSQPVTKRPP